jgi:hypothetical protein
MLAVFTMIGVVPTSVQAAAVDVPDQVLAWNLHAYNELIVGKGQSPPVAALHLAMVHGAIYDAVNDIDGGYQPYLAAPEFIMADLPATDTKAGYSKEAAAAAAGYQILLHLLPDRAAQLAAYYAASLEPIPDGEAEDGGIAVGNAAAAAMIAARRDDGRYGNPSFTEGWNSGQWRALASGLAGNNFRWIGNVRPFLVPDASQLATDGPLQLASASYAAELDQVKALGRADSVVRTADQTQQARFWADHALAMWTRIFQQVSTSQKLDTVENARYFAMLYLTGADAVIACFQDKERWGFWRPQTAIREAGDDGNPATVADPAWTSLLTNPPYPDHPSGHNCVSNSFVQTLRDFFGTDRIAFSATHATLGITRNFTHFSQAINEIRLARVYGGIHFMTADAQGATLGRKVADWRQRHYFQPTT